MRIALTHWEEVTRLLEQHDKLVRKMHMEMEAVAEPVVPTIQGHEASVEEDAENEEAAEPSILNVLNEDQGLKMHIL
jgi:hypothetical protein